jgi:hypothetical protein
LHERRRDPGFLLKTFDDLDLSFGQLRLGLIGLDVLEKPGRPRGGLRTRLELIEHKHIAQSVLRKRESGPKPKRSSSYYDRISVAWQRVLSSPNPICIQFHDVDL